MLLASSYLQAVFVATCNYSATAFATSDPVYCHRYFEARLVVMSFRSVFFLSEMLAPFNSCYSSSLKSMSFRTALKKTFAQHC